MPMERHRTNDHFVLSEDNINELVYNFLKQKGFTCPIFKTGREQGIDVQGKKNGWTVVVDSKGNHANHHNDDIVFDRSQLWDHLAKQVVQLMKYQTDYPENTIYIAANPAIDRIQNGYLKKVEKSLDRLGIIRLWIQQDMSITLEIPTSILEIATELGITD